jgi:hypothetical protein
MQFSKVLSAALLLLVAASLGDSQDKPTLMDPRGYLAELRRLSAKRPFLRDSPDVYLESQSLGRFFTREIYQKLRGNAYFGYEHDEGFRMEGKEIQIELLRDLTSGQPYQSAYRLALEQSLKAAAFKPKPAASHQVGLCIVGVEPKETAKTLPGVMVEVYLRNSRLKKSLFIRYGSGHPRGLPAAIRLSAEMLVAQLCSRTKNDECSSTR